MGRTIIFWCSDYLPFVQNFYIFWLLHSSPQSSSLRVTWDAVCQAWSPKNSHWIQHNIQFFKDVNIFRSTQFSVISDSLRLHEPQHARPPCPLSTPRVHPNPRPSSQWCHPTVSSSVVPFSSSPQSFPASGSFQTSQFFASGGRSLRVSASTRAINSEWRIIL